jgi:hypothetical protein
MRLPNGKETEQTAMGVSWQFLSYHRRYGGTALVLSVLAVSIRFEGH